ncbi:MAG TPA: hypothetical protein VGE07_15140 [Herpetosiphonaceae bacterium]
MDTPTDPTTSAPLACNLQAIPLDERERHVRTAPLLFQRVREQQELPDGLAFRFAADDYLAVADFIAYDRLCCPFFSFTVEVSPNHGPVWLRITGPAGAKAELVASLIDALPAAHAGSAQ